MHGSFINHHMGISAISASSGATVRKALAFFDFSMATMTIKNKREPRHEPERGLSDHRYHYRAEL